MEQCEKSKTLPHSKRICVNDANSPSQRTPNIVLSPVDPSPEEVS